MNSQEARTDNPLPEVPREIIDPNVTLIRTKELALLVGLKRSTISKYIQEKKDEGFPQPVKLSSGDHRGAPVAFVLSEVQQWVRSRIELRDRSADHE